jgi:hypothetical protein
LAKSPEALLLRDVRAGLAYTIGFLPKGSRLCRSMQLHRLATSTGFGNVVVLELRARRVRIVVLAATVRTRATGHPEIALHPPKRFSDEVNGRIGAEVSEPRRCSCIA